MCLPCVYCPRMTRECGLHHHPFLSLVGDHTEVPEISQSWPASPRPRGSRSSNLDKGPLRDSGQDKVPIPTPHPPPWELGVEMGALEAGWSRDPPVTAWRTPLLTTWHLARMRGKCLWESSRRKGLFVIAAKLGTDWQVWKTSESHAPVQTWVGWHAP